MAFPTATEQYLLELVNKARENPLAEAARLGIDLNKDLAPGTISTNSVAPLAFSTFLNIAADKHSQSMINDNYFSHTGSDGSTPTQRIFDAGWTSSSNSFSTGENIGFSAGNSGYNAATIQAHHDGLFKSSGHRLGIMNPGFSEIGIGHFVGSYTTGGITYVNTASMVTEKFAEGGRDYLTGVVIADADGDKSYDIGEGQAGVTIKATGQNGVFTTTTWDAGGYSLALAAGNYTVEFSGGGLNGTIQKTVTIGTSNVKVDALTTEAMSVSKTIVGGPSAEVLTGDVGNDMITGAGGNDTINGGGGIDTAKYLGNSKQFTVTITKGAAITVTDRSGAEGTDSLTGIENLDFLTGKDVNLDILDGVVNLSSADLSAFIELYIAYFNRAPDAEGLFYWATRLSEGMTKNQIAEAFFEQPETQALYPNPNDTEGFVKAVYKNFLGREPEAGGFAFWVQQLNDGAISKPLFLLAIIDGAKAPTSGQSDVDYFTKKAEIGAYFAVIKGMGNAENANAAMALYDGSAASITAAKNAIDGYYINALDANNGELLINLVGVMNDPFIV